MNPKTELAIRGIAATDASIKPTWVEDAITILKNGNLKNPEVEHVLRRKQVMELLHIHRRTLDYYLDRGYLDRVYGGGERALGISRSSYLRFIEQRINH